MAKPFSVVRGKRIRATRVGPCGLPQQGEGSQLVTDGFVTVTYTRVNKDAEDLEQTNADGQVCVADRTAPELKWYEVSIELCNVHPDLLSFFTDDPVVLDHKQEAVGFRSAKTVKVDGGVALELWTGTASEDCEVPEDDSALEEGANAVSYGYWLTPWIKEATIGDIEVGASVLTLTLTGITGAPTKWGRGPYNVVPTDDQNTPGRLLTPMGREHMHMQRTTIAPPEITDGAQALTLPMPYFGADALNVADSASNGGSESADDSDSEDDPASEDDSGFPGNLFPGGSDPEPEPETDPEPETETEPGAGSEPDAGSESGA